MKAIKAKQKNIEGLQPFQLVKYISLSSLMVILVCTLLLSTFISQRAKNILVKKSEQYAFLLAENLNNQVFFEFTLPTLISEGEIRLSRENQFKRLDKVVRNTIHGFGIESVNIYDPERLLTYSTKPEGIGTREELGDAFVQAMNGKSVSLLQGEQKGFWEFVRGDSSRKLNTYLPMQVEKPMSWKRGKVLGVFEITQDVTDDYKTIHRFQWIVMLSFLVFVGVLFVTLLLIAKRAEGIIAARTAEREKLEEQLHQAERLAALGEMIAGVSHEIRNPLGIIRSTAELLHTRVENDRQKRLSSIIVEESTRLNDILTEFLDFARPKTPRLSSCRMEDILERNLRVIEADCQKRGIRVEREYQENGHVLEADADLLYRAVVNLLSNALQAMPEGGVLQVQTSVLTENRFAKNSSSPFDTYGCIEVRIRDSGYGIAEDKKKKIFNPFFTTREKGTGLGLAIVQSIIDTHHGEIEVESEEGKGTTIILRLPLAQPEAETEAGAAAA